ncbi:MAG: SAM-dependent methyltransferase [Succinivibrio sp.]
MKMEYVKSKKYQNDTYMKRIMGPNPIKLTEELMMNEDLKRGSLVLDLGCGQGASSVFLAKEYGVKVTACDLWCEASENQKFFDSLCVSDRITAVNADAMALPFAKESFDAVVCVDSYNFFGREDGYLDEKLLPFIKKGGSVYISVTGFNKDCHHDIPDVLLKSWSAEQLDYIHDCWYYLKLISRAKGCELRKIEIMKSNEEVWRDWLETDNPYAQNDRQSIEAGALEYLNFIKIVLKKI